MSPVALYVLVGVLGLLIGSFLNVVIYRVPRDLSVVRPPSACPSCDEPIRARDNIPVLSWLLLRGRCRHCAARISPSYATVEIVTGLLFLLMAWRIGPHVDLVAFLALVSGLVPLSVIDAQFMLLPRRLVYTTLFGVFVGLGADVAVHHDDAHQFVGGLIAAAVWWVAFNLINLVSPRYLGFGDVRLTQVLGMSLGWFGWAVPIAGLYLAALYGVVGWAVFRRKPVPETGANPRGLIPFGPYLAAGAITAVAFHPLITSLSHHP